MTTQKATDDTTTASNNAATANPVIRPIGEVHAELIDEAQKQADFNAQQHAIQAEEANRFNNLSSGYVLPKPDDARAEALAVQKAQADQSAANTADASTAKNAKAPAKTTTAAQTTGQN